MVGPGVAIVRVVENDANSDQTALPSKLWIRNGWLEKGSSGSWMFFRARAIDGKEVYAAVGTPMTLRRLCELMITVSSNFAANVLLEKLGVDNVRRTVTSLGGDGMQVLRGVEDQKAFDKGLNNTTTARGLLVLFERLAHAAAVDAQSDAAMIDILKRQQFNDGIPAGVPPGTPVAHKTGTITRIHHDAGIVYAARPYVLVILVRGLADQKKSAALMADLSRLVFASASR